MKQKQKVILNLIPTIDLPIDLVDIGKIIDSKLFILESTYETLKQELNNSEEFLLDMLRSEVLKHIEEAKKKN